MFQAITMPASGHLLVVQRSLTVLVFKVVRLVFTVVQGIYWRLNGTARRLREARHPDNYERCAQVLDIVFLHKFCHGQPICLEDYLCTHNRFENPQYVIDNDHIILINISGQNAVFGEAREKGKVKPFTIVFLC
jgi:hypothetical protein